MPSAPTPSLPFIHDVSGIIGAGGLTQAQYDAHLAATGPALESLRRQHADSTLPLLHLPKRRDDIVEMERIAAHLKKDATDIVVLGIGGSSLGAKAVAQLAYDATPAQSQTEPRVHFFENLDPHTFERALQSLDLRTTRFLVVSKSGGTAEPLMQAYAAKAALEAAGGGDYLAQHFAAITEPSDNPVRRFATGIGAPVIDHDPRVGGRFSILTNVGLVPAMLMGLDVVAVREGADRVLAPVIAGADPQDVAPAAGAVMQVGLAQEAGAAASVIMAYSDRLERFGQWYRQLWAESLGKDGRGTVPATGIGPVDQHSQLQLYLAGPADKAYTIMSVGSAGAGPRVATDDPALDYLNGKTMGDLMDAEYRATVATLKANKRPVRTIDIPVLDETAMGALLMHFMLETIIAAHLMGVDPFDQPAVEEGKILARKYLGEM
ncbi:glucose-6-phosphate isomerase [Pyruvatibacter sp. HU-CL02332]|uniref:glucose-6-phosphate isomerase n=1 Tax=Pyruvatibacter sp. HU-CL02332 TaxID=3127650 RepID=UPI003106DCDA